ncbi:hypothetical protein [Vibrio parahaemolyticus]|uniref:hypothetical protein n=1 Tax=Vibrio harveyi group TaxID=717610 RepID=UPI002A0E996E|nr:hypothetical protein [Vibrio parahaemolyticus]HEQ3589943.1 hypothetical protein [Vibrio harveyi]MDF5599670.1 hypothetical protein [Vibrio parahaemolyticus]MEA5385439.1 hypothetical protein [Vibrio parahaemolyticus]HEQ3598410.1 hypothetical protein [Vibrio harveyi]HEQ3610635.1 hypothetical protein [Vibrio harveyi]
MNNIQVQRFGQATSALEDTSDFEAMILEFDQSTDISEGGKTDYSNDVLGDEEAVEIILEQAIINETIRKMKQDEQRLKEIFDET